MINIQARLPDGNIHNIEFKGKDTVRALKLQHQPQLNTCFDNIGVMYNNKLVQEHMTFQSILPDTGKGLSFQLICFDQYFQQYKETIGDLTKKLEKLEQMLAQQTDDIATQKMIQEMNQEAVLEQESNLTQQLLEYKSKMEAGEAKQKQLSQANKEISTQLQNEQNSHQYDNYNANQITTQISQQYNDYRLQADNRIEDLNNELQEKKKLLNKLSYEVQTLKDSNEQMKSHNKIVADDLNKEIDTLNKKLKISNDDIMNRQQNGQNDVAAVEQQLLNVKQELKQTKFVLLEQQSIASKVPTLETKLKEEYNNLNTTRQNLNNTIAELQTKIQSLEQIQLQLENKLQKTEREKQDSDRINQQKIQAFTTDIQLLNDKLSSLTQAKEELEQATANQTIQIEQKANAVAELEKQEAKQQKDTVTQIKDLRSQLAKLNNEKSLLETAIFNKDKSIQDLKNDVVELQKLLQQSTDQLQQVIKSNEIIINEMQSKEDYQIEVIQQIRSKIPNNFKLKIKGVVEQLRGKYPAITDFAKDESGSLTDAKFKVWKVEINQEALEKRLIQEGKLIFKDLVKFTEQADINGKRTINAIVQDADLQQGFIFQNSDPLAQVGLLLLRQFKDLPPHFAKKEEAAQQVINNLLVHFMINDLNKQLSAQGKPKLDVKVAPQFVVQIAGEPKFYHAELLIDGPFTKFNGGDFELQSSPGGQIANTLTYYSYQRTNGKLCISHLQSLGNTYYDAIVSSEYGLIGQGDLGRQEIQQVIEKIEKGKADLLHPEYAKIRAMLDKK